MWSSRSSAGASEQAAALVWPRQVILRAASNLHHTERKLAERLSDGKKQAGHIERWGRWRQAFISEYLQASGLRAQQEACSSATRPGCCQHSSATFHIYCPEMENTPAKSEREQLNSAELHTARYQRTNWKDRSHEGRSEADKREEEDSAGLETSHGKLPPGRRPSTSDQPARRKS